MSLRQLVLLRLRARVRTRRTRKTLRHLISGDDAVTHRSCQHLECPSPQALQTRIMENHPELLNEPLCYNCQKLGEYIYLLFPLIFTPPSTREYIMVTGRTPSRSSGNNNSISFFRRQKCKKKHAVPCPEQSAPPPLTTLLFLSRVGPTDVKDGGRLPLLVRQKSVVGSNNNTVPLKLLHAETRPAQPLTINSADDEYLWWVFVPCSVGVAG